MVPLRFAARDPGGANVLAGFLSLHAPGLEFDIWTLPRATPVFQRTGFLPREFPGDVNPAQLEAAWIQSPASRLVTGTSHYAAFEACLWSLARNTDGVSLAVNDSWSNLAERFQAGRPDFVGAVDDGQVPELAALDFRPEQVIVTGHPWLSALMARRDEIAAAGSTLTRQADVQVLFASECIASDVAQGLNTAFGFDEFDSFLLLRQAAVEVVRSGLSVKLAIKFHPYEDAADFMGRLTRLPIVPGLTVLPLDPSEKPHPWILWADLVAGISSMLLLEAIVLDRPVISLQPGLTREDTFIASRRGFARSLTDGQTVIRDLTELLGSREARQLEVTRNRDFLQTIPSDPYSAILGWIVGAGAA